MPSTIPVRIKASQIALHREAMRAKNRGLCGLCRLPLTEANARLDHCHSTGALRDSIHNGCNALLGKVENNYKRYGVTNLGAFLHGAADYLQRHATNVTGLTHPTHKTDEEKRLRTNALARARRAAKQL